MIAPIPEFTVDGGLVATVGVAAASPSHLVLVALDANGACHVADQTAAGAVHHRLGPITEDAAMDAVRRILTGRDKSVTGDGLAAAATLLALKARDGAS
jgi:hypothetical protein